MIELIFANSLLSWNGNLFQVVDSYADGEINANLNLVNEDNNFWVLFLANETTINGVLQTSAQMIINTLTNA
jgi:hypothetical protein